MRPLLFFLAALAAAQGPRGSLIEESKVPSYTLPDLKLTTAEAWKKTRRAEIFRLFESQMYGRMPEALQATVFEPAGVSARLKEIDVLFSGKREGPKMRLDLHLPANARRAPVFVGPMFSRQTERERARWPVELITSRGYALAVFDYQEVTPDKKDSLNQGIHQLFKMPPAPDEWGAIGAWAWALRRVADYLEKDPAIDAGRMAVVGHSRLGKTALWAGAVDERFALVISNDSGEGGASLARRQFGERTHHLNESFPYWFAANFLKYGHKEETLPFDQHMLLALMAPRPVYVASAEEDAWADPRGEFLSLKHADPVWRLLGKPGLGVAEMPAVNQPAGVYNRYHVRTGKHDMTEYDWRQWLDWADMHFRMPRR